MSLSRADRATESGPTAAREPGAARLGRTDAKLGTALKWSYLLSTGGYAVVALLTFVLAAILDPREFGVLAMALVWATLAVSLLQHGPTMAVIQQDDITDDHVNAAFWSTLAGAAGFSLLFAAAAPLWAALNRLPELTAVCLALTPLVMIQALNVIPDAVLRRRMQMRGIAIRALVSNLVGGVAGIACAVAGLGVWSLVVQQLTAPTLYAVMLWSMTDWRPRLGGPLRQPLRDIRRTSLQTYGGAVGNFLSIRSDVLLMGVFFGPVVIGLYRFAARFADIVIEVTAGGLQQVSLAHLARHGDDRPALARELGRLMHGTAVLAFPMLGVVAGVAHPLVLVIGEQWADAAGPLRVLCVVSGVWMVGTMLGLALNAAQRAGIPAAFTWITMACSASAIVIGSRLSAGGSTAQKLMAVALGMLAVQVGVVGAMCYVVFRRVLRTSIGPTVRGALPGAVSGASAAVAGSVVHPLVDAALATFPALVVTGTAATAAAGVALLALDGEVRGRVSRLARRLRRSPAAA